MKKKSQGLIPQMLSSNTNEWETPDDLYNILNNEFDFAFDLAATKENSKCGDNFLGPGSLICEDALKYNWDCNELQGKICWLNPPYSRGLQDPFVKKCLNLKKDNCNGFKTRVVALLPVRTASKRWQAIASQASFIYFLRKRLKFKTNDPTQKVTSAPFDSAIVGFNFNDEYISELIYTRNKLDEVSYLIDSFQHIYEKYSY